jgi:hypothetical protein
VEVGSSSVDFFGIWEVRTVLGDEKMGTQASLLGVEVEGGWTGYCVVLMI